TGTPGFAPGKKGQAYAGASDGYLTFGLSDLPEALGTDFSVGFWYKVNASPDRAGIIVIGPEDNSRIHGFRLFRENAGGKQRIKANVGNGTAEGWVDNENGKADLDPADNAWHYITLTLTKGKATLYVDGEEAATNNLTEISWESCDIMSIGSGAPRFTEWNHLSDESLIDELRLFNKALTPAEIQDVMK
ncbi:MAG: LamG domain-containing protein, partial [Proteiniphilum sp.]|nr:LamG domain-containing protein [Proteiniphilum sp.]